MAWMNRKFQECNQRLSDTSDQFGNFENFLFLRDRRNINFHALTWKENKKGPSIRPTIAHRLSLITLLLPTKTFPKNSIDKFHLKFPMHESPDRVPSQTFISFFIFDSRCNQLTNWNRNWQLSNSVPQISFCMTLSRSLFDLFLYLYVSEPFKFPVWNSDSQTTKPETNIYKFFWKKGRVKFSLVNFSWARFSVLTNILWAPLSLHSIKFSNCSFFLVCC